MNLRNALLAAAVVAAPILGASAVQAQALNGVYIGAGAGINWMAETGVNPGSAKATSDGVGFVGLGSIGYGFGNGVRVELEGNYRYQPVKIGALKGHGSSYGPMVNALFDFDAGLGFTPYVGAGVGYQWGDINVGGRANGKGTWAAQGILGAAFPIADVPGLAVTAEARVLGTLEKVRYGNAGGSTDPQLHVSGLLGRDVDTATGREAAKLCAINILAQAKAALGDLEKIARIVKIKVFVASTPEFTEQHLVANGASDFLAKVLGERGKHARSAVGTASLPLNAAVEVEAIIEVA